MIDTAQGFEAWRKSLSSVLESEKCTVSTALLTHWHPDHIFGVPDLKSLCPDAKIYKHPSSLPTLLDSDPETGIPRETVHVIADGQVFEAEGVTLKTVHAPGHTDDHCCFSLKEEKGALFAADNVLGHGTSVFEDLALYLSGLRKIRMSLGEEDGEVRLYPGHGPMIEEGKAKIEEYIKHRRDREEQVLNVMGVGKNDGVGAKDEGDGWTSMDIVKIVYADVRQDLYEAAERGIGLILSKLAAEGRVRRDGDTWFLIGKSAL